MKMSFVFVNSDCEFICFVLKVFMLICQWARCEHSNSCICNEVWVGCPLRIGTEGSFEESDFVSKIRTF